LLAIERGIQIRRAMSAGVAALFVAGAMAAPAPAAQQQRTLRILVTNDDGVGAPGIDVLVEALRTLPDVAVTVVAPAHNQSGVGDRAMTDLASLTAADSTTSSGYRAVAVDGTPADSVIWALRRGVQQRPDVVVSGINSGENVGSLTALSGTLGAARIAARNGVRALAVSQGGAEQPDYPTSARYAVDWVETRRQELLARRSEPATDLVAVDSLNVPTCTRGSVRGLVSVPVASVPPTKGDCSSTLEDPADDVEAFTNGFAVLSHLQVSAVCARFTPATGSGAPATLQDTVLSEVSGAVASRAHPPVLWVHNDSGGEPAVHAVTPEGKSLGAYTVEGATVLDWEDLAIGPGPGRGTSYLYIGDIGDNLSARDRIVVYRVAEPAEEPDGTGGTLEDTETFSLRYPDGPVDAEALLVDPKSGDLYVIDKEYTTGVGKVFRAKKRQLVDGADRTLRRVASFRLAPDRPDDPTGGFPGTMVTGADVSPDGNLVLVRTYRRVLAFVRPEGKDLVAAFGVDACTAPQTPERQGEAVAFTADGKGYVTIGEGVHARINAFVTR
jgi:5'-nucleotidase